MDAFVATAAAAPASPVAGRPGYDPDAAATARRVLPLLAGERVVWLSTVGADGSPHLVPTWFWWDGETLLFWSKPDAVKVRNLLANPRLMLAVGDAGADFSVGLIEAVATPSGAPVPDAFFAKYADAMADAGLDPASFRARHTVAMRVTPARFLAWHGLGPRHETAAAPRTGWPRPAHRLRVTLDAIAARLRPHALGRAAA